MDKNYIDIEYVTLDMINSEEDLWINPVGGYGDMLMISGALKLSLDSYPSRKYKLARRTQYSHILEEHPAIAEIGYPPQNSKIVCTNYWSRKEYFEHGARAFQIMSKIFGLVPPVKEKLYLHDEILEDPILFNTIPWAKKNILIAPASESIRKTMHPMKWHVLVERLNSLDTLVLQVGRTQDIHIKGTYSLLGLTTPKELIHLIKNVDLVITLDNFIMHAAHLYEIPAVVFFGPTLASKYGYSEQNCIQAPLEHCSLWAKCLGSTFSENYTSECPLGLAEHCMNKIPDNQIIDSVIYNI